ncbi:hypothetical protein CPC08DRAFT_446627 [Agrocybe pediades]|nr:hypothetical protein CPC08DRAFT_446627 [Agrocybe pediades]
MNIHRGYNTLPQEICGIICADPCLDQRDLHNLCFVSRSFNAEAERMLYVNVRVQGLRHLKSFCRTMIRRPFLASRIEKLELHMPPQLDLQADDLAKLVRTLKLTSNLTDLRFLTDKNSANIMIATGVDLAEAANAWILRDLKFPLKSFTNKYFICTFEVTMFVQRHSTSLEMLTLEGNDHNVETSGLETLDMPHLHTLCGSARVMRKFSSCGFAEQLLRVGIKIQDCTDMTSEMEQIALLTFYRKNLQSLKIERRSSYKARLGYEALVACTKLVTPNIKHLQILDYGDSMVRERVRSILQMGIPVKRCGHW